MSIAELINQVGSENIEFQLLPESLIRADLRKDHGEICFGTTRDKIADMVAENPKQMCIIMWIPRDKLPKTEPATSATS